MIGRGTRICLEVVIGLIAGLMLLGGIVIWRLSSGPVDVDFLTPYLESALSDEASGITVDIDETVLTWEGWSRTIDLRARRTRLIDASGRRLAALPDVSVMLSMRALVQGEVAPTVIDLVRPRIALVRRADGRIELDQEAESASDHVAVDEGGVLSTLPAQLDQLMSEPSAERPLAFLRKVRFSDGVIYLRDEATAREWRVSGVSLEVEKDDVGLSGGVALAFGDEFEPSRLEAAFVLDPAQNMVDLAGEFTDLRPAEAASFIGSDTTLEGIDIALRGTLSLTARLDGGIESVSVTARGGPGLLTIAEVLPEARPVKRVEISGRYDGQGGGVDLETAVIAFAAAEGAGPTLELSGQLRPQDDDYAVALQAKLSDVALDALEGYWPQGLVEGAREWVTANLRTGVAREVGADVAMTLPGGVIDAAVVESVTGSIEYSDLDVHFLRPMPPVTAVSGTAIFDLEGMSLAAASGRLGALQVLDTKIEITGFQDVDQIMTINVPVSGGLQDMLTLLNHERLGLIDRLGIDPATAGGQAAARVNFQFPLLQDLTFEQIDVQARANLSEVALSDVVADLDASDGTLALDLTKSSMRVVGPLALAGVPVELDWTEDFTGASNARSTINLVAPRVEDADRKVLGVDFIPGLEGPVSASLAASLRRDDTALVKTAVNLKEASLAIPVLEWSKAPGIAGEAHATFAFSGERLTDLPSFRVAAGTLAAEGSLRLAPDGQRVAEARLDRLIYDTTALRNLSIRRNGEAFDIRIGSGRLNAAPFLEASKGVSGESGEAGAGVDDLNGLQITAGALDTLLLAEDRFITNVSLALERNAEGWNLFQVRGNVPPRFWYQDERPVEPVTGSANGTTIKILEINFRPNGTGSHRLDVTTNDAGAVLRALDLLDTMEGGETEITAANAPGEPLRGSIETSDLKMVNAPVLARLLLVASLTGIVEALQGEGLEFDRLTGDFEYRDGVLRSDLVRAYGPSLGITAKGQIDFDGGQVDVVGTIVPAYLLNQILGNIPVLGPILTGGEGEGFVAFTYKIEGNLDEPEVSVNPLSALAPGFLRTLFSGDIGDEEATVFPTGVDR